MNPEILNLTTVVLLLLFTGASCQKDEMEYADENIVVSNRPCVFIFKTKDNYSDKIWVQITPEGNLNRIPVLNKQNYDIDKNGKLKPKYRYILKSGYMVGDAHEWAAFTDITFTEYLSYNEKYGITHWPDTLLWPRIIDKDPYIELFWMGCLDCKIKEFTLGEINEMIEDGTIEKHFTKLK